MKTILFLLLLQSTFSSAIRGQCSTYIEMVDVVVEGCILPVVVETQQVLLPCSAPPELYQMNIGDFAYVDYTLSGCASFCQLGEEVNITCFSFSVGIEDGSVKDEIEVFPNPTQSEVFIRAEDIIQLRLFTETGFLLEEHNHPEVSSLDISRLTRGVYFFQIVTLKHTHVKRIIKV